MFRIYLIICIYSNGGQSLWNVTNEVIKKEGVTALYRGWQTRVLIIGIYIIYYYIYNIFEIILIYLY